MDNNNDNGIISNDGSCEHINMGLFCLADNEYMCFGNVAMFLSSIALVSADGLQILSSFFH